MARVFYLTLAILVGIAGLVFHVRNRQEIVLNYLVGSFEVELSWALVATLIAGVVLGIVGMSSSLVQARRQARRHARRADQIERELARLRATALKDAG